MLISSKGIKTNGQKKNLSLKAESQLDTAEKGGLMNMSLVHYGTSAQTSNSNQQH